MKTEKDKMLGGEPYDPLDIRLREERLRARLLIKELNAWGTEQIEERRTTLRKLIPNGGEDLWIDPPFFCDYGYNLHIGEKVFFNFNCVVLDVMPVKIGSRTLIGSNVQIYAVQNRLP